MKRKICILFVILSLMCSTNIQYIWAEPDVPQEVNEDKSSGLSVDARSAVLMEASTGTILFKQNEHEAMPPASVTKIMTMLLAYEAIEEGKMGEDDIVTISENASGYGGSTIFLETNEKIPVKQLLKGMAVQSGNDSAIAIGEYVGGSQEGFVNLMNEKAKELNMNDTHFVNPCGLDADGHLTSANDVAIMSRELITKYPQVLDLTSIWFDTLIHQRKNGEEETSLTNTNSLINWYEGANGLKTGFTSKAMYCLSATAERNGLKLIAVVMGAKDKQTRTNEIVKLLDYGFGNYSLFSKKTSGKSMGKIPVEKGNKKEVDCIVKNDIQLLISKKEEKDMQENLKEEVQLPENINAPLKKGDKLGTVNYKVNGKTIGTSDIICGEDVEKARWKDYMIELLRNWL